MSSKFNDILRGKFLVSDDSFKNWRVIVFLLFLALVMTASSHSIDKKVYEIAKLKDQVKELRSELFDGRTRLMQLKMESNVVKEMEALNIAPSVIPPKKILVKESK